MIIFNITGDCYLFIYFKCLSQACLYYNDINGQRVSNIMILLYVILCTKMYTTKSHECIIMRKK